MDWDVSSFQFHGFEWDNEKAESNRRKHGIDFEDAKHVFTQNVVARTQFEGGEIRWQAIGIAAGRELFIAFVENDGYCRIISARRCTRKEAGRYYALLNR